jgi:membrane peptidoglycan carboxypeptidase
MIRNGATRRSSISFPRTAGGLPPALRVALWPVALAGVIGLSSLLVAAGLMPVIGGAGLAERNVQQRLLGNIGVPLHLPRLQQRSTIYSADGKVLAHLSWVYNRKTVLLQNVAPIARTAVLAIEDHKYYEHGPIDVPSIVRAVFANLRAHQIVQGASTIAQQLVKNTETGNAETFQRKIQEARDAMRLERTNSKDAIFQAYLNQIYLGHGVYGIGTAAEWYFGKPASKLTLPEAALLAGMIKGPEVYDPVGARGVALARRNVVLEDMLQYGMITSDQYQAAARSPIKLSRAKRSVVKQPLWVNYVTGEFLNDPRFGRTYEDRKNLLFRGGLRIYTTVKTSWQDAAAKAMAASHMSGPYQPQQAVVSVVPQTGAIRAMQVGNWPWPEHKYNLVTDPGGGRSAGSAFKAYTLATALMMGISPDATYNGNSPKTIPNCGGGSTWTVNNAEPGGGTYTLRSATWASVNAVFAQVINQVGPENVADVAKRMGITSNLSPSYCPLTLGASPHGINPLEMASGYATLANGGVHCQPYSIARIVGPDGKMLFRQRPRCEQAIPPGVASLETSILQGVLTSGTAAGQGLGARPAAGKTGTGENFQDAWFVGYVRQLSTAVWTGWAVSDNKSLGPNGFGGVMSAPVWHRYMMAVLAGAPIERFPYAPPPKVRTTHVPSVIGKTVTAASAILTQAKLGMITKTGPSNQPKGVIFKQTPGAGASAPLGSEVTVWVSNGKKPPPEQVKVPNVMGKAKAEAKAILMGAGFHVTVEQADVSDPAQDGVVISQTPVGGANAKPGSTVLIVVGKFKGSPSPPPPH